MKRFCNSLAALLLAGLLLVAGAVPALALTSADLDLTRKGSITVTLKDPKTENPVMGGALTLYQVAKVQKQDADLSFVYTNGFEECGVALGDLSEADLADALEAARPASAQGVTEEIGNDGKATFAGLPLGLYLVVQSTASTGYEAINPFVVTLPLAVGESYLYEVDALPKVGTLTASVPPDLPDEPEEPADSEPVAPVTPVSPTEPTKPESPAGSTPTAEEPDDPNKQAPNGDNPDDWVLNGRPDANKPGTPGADNPDDWVLNGRPGRLAQTGQLNWPIPVLVCAGAVLIVLGILFRKKR